MHNNAELLSRLSSNAYEFDKRENAFSFKEECCCLLTKKRNFHSIRTLVPANVCFKKTKYFNSEAIHNTHNDMRG